MPMACLNLQCHRHTACRQGRALQTMALGWTLCLDRALGVTLTNRIQYRTVGLQYMRRRQVHSLSRSLRSGDLPRSRMLRKIASTACMVSSTVSPSGCLNFLLADRGTQALQVLAAATIVLTTSTAVGDKASRFRQSD
jgi:hypothetical protein